MASFSFSPTISHAFSSLSRYSTAGYSFMSPPLTSREDSLLKPALNVAAILTPAWRSVTPSPLLRIWGVVVAAIMTARWPCCVEPSGRWWRCLPRAVCRTCLSAGSSRCQNSTFIRRRPRPSHGTSCCIRGTCRASCVAIHPIGHDVSGSSDDSGIRVLRGRRPHANGIALSVTKC